MSKQTKNEKLKEQVSKYHELVTLGETQHIVLKAEYTDRILHFTNDRKEREEEVCISDTEVEMLPVSKIIELLQK